VDKNFLFCRIFPKRIEMSRTVVLLILAIFFNALANILVKIGMIRIGKMEGWGQMLSKVAVQPAFILGVISFALALLAYSAVLTRLNLSVAYPIMISMGLVLVVFASYFLLNESIRFIQLVGFLLIIAGIWMVAR